MEFGVLGPLEVLRSGRPLSLGGARRRALLAILLIHVNSDVSRDRLLDLMWGAAPPVNAGKIIQIYISQLRKLLQQKGAPEPRGQSLVTQPNGYSMRLSDDQLDSSRFERLLAEGRRALGEGRSPDASRRLREALALWRGPALADFAFEGFAQAEIARLEELRITALEDRLKLDLGVGRHAHVIAELETLIGENPLRENLSALLMVALYRSGRQGEALQAYQHTRSVLVEELGVDPGPELQQLEQAILTQDPALGSPTRQAGEVLSVRLAPHNLPLQLTRLVGRERDIQELKHMIPEARLLTLTGMGGSGKTRLALELAQEVSGLYAHGVWLVELADVSEGALVSVSVASVFGVREQPGRSLEESVAETLSDKQMLIVMDNCEHLIESCAEMIQRLLRTCPQVDVLATSRAPIGIMGETVRSVTSLPTPDTDDPSAMRRPEAHGAVQLFVERARAVVSDFSLNDIDAPAVAEICVRLGGSPLAIELAAARMRVLSAEQIASRLDDRFRLLAGGGRSTAQRQRSLQATMSWSYDLLSEPERALFRRLCVFAGGYSLEAAEAVCAADGIATVEVLDLLNALVDQSLVAVAGRTREVRYALSDTVRQYGRERLTDAGEETRVCRRHAEWLVSLVEEAHDGLRGPEQALWLERLDLEHNNLRAALGWSLEHDPAVALQMAGQAWWFWLLRGHFGEGRRWLEEALVENEQAQTVSRCLALGGAGVLAAEQGDISRANALLEQSLSLARRLDYGRGTMSALNNLGALAEYEGDYQRSAQLCEESIELSRVKGDKEIVASALINLATAYREQGHLDKAYDLLEESMTSWQGQKNDWGVAEATLNLAIVERARGDYSEAERLCELSQGLYRGLGDKEGTANSCVVLGTVAHLLGDKAAALRHFQEGLEIYRRLGDKEGVARTMEGLSTLAVDLGEVLPAAVLLGAAESLRSSIGAPRPPSERADIERKLVLLGTKLGDDALTTALTQGRRMTVEDGWSIAADVIARRGAAQPSRVSR